MGHLIYRLKDRIWPDFVCHFHLFNGRFAKAPITKSCWHADTELTDLLACRPLALKSLLDFLRPGSQEDHSSRLELNKFGLIPIDHMEFSNTNVAEASSSGQASAHNIQIHFGSFSSDFTEEPTLDNHTETSGSINRLALMEHFLSQADLEEK